MYNQTNNEANIVDWFVVSAAGSFVPTAATQSAQSQVSTHLPLPTPEQQSMHKANQQSQAVHEGMSDK